MASAGSPEPSNEQGTLDKRAPCSGLRKELKDCLLSSDCVNKYGHSPKDCLNAEMVGVDQDCRQTQYAFFDCKRSLKSLQSMEHLRKVVIYDTGDRNALLEFTTQASVFLNSVLKRPTKSKRKINHRKFLQKQLSAFSHYKTVFISETEHGLANDYYDCKQHPQIHEPAKKRQNLNTDNGNGLEEQSFAKLFNPSLWATNDNINEKDRPKFSLKYRQLPQSFWKEPKMYNLSKPLVRKVNNYDQGHKTADSLDFLGIEFDEILEKLSESEDSEILSTSSNETLRETSSIDVIEQEIRNNCNMNTGSSLESLSKYVYDQFWNMSVDIPHMGRLN